ncbi:hypothetical protein SAMN05421734_101149 [Pelagirhabdus alkalitolerans]|uniref:Uncharacterized protein n=1 Tax=Pelagirhabdus alkalitolerans TaxID=1612202 RepID=A0A1G6GIQ8_9BACI|nr:hypothetical protein [Pelagirhabdus alkalitolerans]SDB81901.1 hypothetical protein SAMN05421734_101149 [Pelagirhabdus alkalitolerans]
MPRFKSIVSLLLMSLFLVGCQQNNLNLSDSVTHIDIYDWESAEKVERIDDQTFIEELVETLDRAHTESTANMDFVSPDYELQFQHNEETLFELGYYVDVMDLGTEGRYWDFNNDEMYDVTMELPVIQ